MQQEADAVHVLEKALTPARFRGKSGRRRFFVLADEFGDLTAVGLRRGEAQFFLERLLQDLNIFVLAEDEGNNQPVVASADLTVGSAVSEESFLLPARHIGWGPGIWFRLLAERRGLMLYVADGQEFSRRDRLTRFSNHDTVHHHLVAKCKRSGRKFVLGGNLDHGRIALALKCDRIFGLQVGESD